MLTLEPPAVVPRAVQQCAEAEKGEVAKGFIFG